MVSSSSELRAIFEMKLRIASVVMNSGIFYCSIVRDTPPLVYYDEIGLALCTDLLTMRFFLGPVIRYLSDNIKQLGGDLHSHNIYCRRCTDRKGGGFDPEYGILICANEMKDQGHLEDTMAHEMVHAYDHLRFKVDWTNNLRHAACTEVFFTPCWKKERKKA